MLLDLERHLLFRDIEGRVHLPLQPSVARRHRVQPLRPVRLEVELHTLQLPLKRVAVRQAPRHHALRHHTHRHGRHLALRAARLSRCFAGTRWSVLRRRARTQRGGGAASGQCAAPEHRARWTLQVACG